MKNIFKAFFFLLFFNFGYSQTSNDTIFITNEKNHKIYVLKNRDSNYYNDLSNFENFKNLDSGKVKSSGLNSKWIRIHKYKEDYILYVPCDWSADTKIVISDKNIQMSSFETDVFKLKLLKKISTDFYKIVFDNNYSKTNTAIEIKLYDKKLGIYQFTINDGTSINNLLFVKPDNYKNFDILVNECINERLSEFKFDE